MARIVVHADDFGLCRSVNHAIVETFQAPVTATSIMTPCVGFNEAIQLYHDRNTHQTHQPLDVGLHFTLTTGGFFPKYAPVNPDVGSLLTSTGVFWTSVAEVAGHADRVDVMKELSAQLECAFESGLDITHLDAHMFVGSIPVVAEAMLEKAWELRIPVVLKDSQHKNLLPVFDSIVSLKKGMDFEKYCTDLVGKKGLHYLILHPALLDDRVADHLPNTWQCRVDDYNSCKTNYLQDRITQYGLTTVGMSEIRDECINENRWF